MARILNIFWKKEDQWEEKKKINLDASLLERTEKKKRNRISFINDEGQDRLLNDTMKGFCHHRYRANFIISDLHVDNSLLDQRLRIGDAIIKITEIGKKCNVNCPINMVQGHVCHVSQYIFFGQLKREGEIKVEDAVDLLY